jgi:hypothetical protein
MVRLRRLSAVLGVTALVGGCGSGGGAGSSPAPPPSGAEAPPSKVPGSGLAGVAVCDQVAGTSGSDRNPGTVLQPLQTAQHLVEALREGQTGCLRRGIFALDEEIEVRTPGITLTSYPGERATLKGRLYVAKGADDVTVSDLDLDERNPAMTGPAVNAAGTTFDNVDVTNYHEGGICFVLGSHEGYGRASGTVIENSRIHDCGQLPPTNQDHGIYLAAVEGAVIRNNWIYGNADRGIQVYPDSQGAHIHGNVIDGNGEGLVISGNAQYASNDNLIEGNVISNSRVRWNVDSHWEGGLVGSGNVVRDNCVWPSNHDSFYNQNGGVLPSSQGAMGFRTLANLTARPLFAAPSRLDFRLRGPRRCTDLLGK